MYFWRRMSDARLNIEYRDPRFAELRKTAATENLNLEGVCLRMIGTNEGDQGSLS